MRSIRIAFLAAVAIASFTALPAGAALIVSHPFGTEDDGGVCTPCYYSPDGVSDSFLLSEAATITGIEARLDIDPDTYFGNIQFSITGPGVSFTRVFGVAALPLAHVAGTGFYYDTAADLGQLSLAAGSYALSIFGLFGGAADSPDNILGWVRSPAGGFSFRIFGDPVVNVPEPSALYLFAAGLLGIALLGRRRVALQRI